VERIEVDGHVLAWERHGDGAVLEVADGTGPCGRPARSTTFVLGVHDGRLRVELALVPTSRRVDVSFQPDLFGQILPVGPGPCADGSAGAAVAHRVASLGAGTAMWCPADPAGSGLLAVVGGAALPLLGAAYDAGAAALGEVPRWAAALLGETTPRRAVRAAFGAKGTKAVARALVAGLVAPHPGGTGGATRIGPAPPDGSVALHRVAAALMGVPALEPDRLARVLAAEGPAANPGQWPDGTQLAVGRAVTSRLGPVGAERVLTEAVTTEDGMTVLDELCRLYPGVADQLPARPPTRLVALRDLCRSLLPLDPDPSADRWGRVPRSPTTRSVPSRPVASAGRAGRGGRPAPGGAVPTRPPTDASPPAARPRAGPGLPRDPRARAHVAPAAPPAPTNAAFHHPPAVAALHGVEVGADLRLLLPRTSDELLAWGRVLRSCVGSFGAAVAAGRSLLIGVEERGALAYCMEVAPDGSVRQFLGQRNRTVPRPVVASVCDLLVVAGVVDPTRTANEVWLGA
jgi:hypothetical protein